MAKSIYEILNTLETETSVPAIKDKNGKIIRENFGEVTHTIPAELFPDDKVFENADDLLEWAETSGFTHALLQKGLQKGLIEIRAIFKACKKDDVWTPEYGQKNVDATDWEITTRPNQTGGKAIAAAKLQAGIEMAKAMQVTGVDLETIQASMVSVYGDSGAASIMESLK